jgi:hypothetical protein
MIEAIERIIIGACGITVAWMVISAIVAYINISRQNNRRRTILRIDRVRQLKKEGFSHREAMELAEKEFH